MGTLRLNDECEEVVRRWAREDRRPLSWVLADLVALGCKARGEFDLAERISERTGKRRQQGVADEPETGKKGP